jgi:phenylacetate-CoA ligase
MRIVRHAYRCVPYYRRLFDAAGLDPRRVRTVADLAELPITTKADLQREPDMFVSRGVDTARLLERRTSGATGQPVAIRNAPWDEFRRHLARWRVDIGYGVRPGDRRMRFRTPRPLLAGDRMLLAALRASSLYAQEKVDQRLSGDEILTLLRDFRPTIIDGMANSIDRAAAVALDLGVTSVRPRFVTTGGETLTDSMRRRIGQAFGAPVYDIYGTCEFGVIAYECKTTRLYHVSPGVALEILRTDGAAASDGEDGRVVATSLLSRTVPVIRYATGDVAQRGPDACECGARVPTLRAIRGRLVDVFRLADGRDVHPWQFPMRTTLWIRSFQFVQEETNRFALRLALAPGVSPTDVENLRHAVLAILGPGAELRIEIVETLDVGPGCKARPFVPYAGR